MRRKTFNWVHAYMYTRVMYMSSAPYAHITHTCTTCTYTGSTLHTRRAQRTVGACGSTLVRDSFLSGTWRNGYQRLPKCVWSVACKVFDWALQCRGRWDCVQTNILHCWTPGLCMSARRLLCWCGYTCVHQVTNDLIFKHVLDTKYTNVVAYRIMHTQAFAASRTTTLD